MPATPPDIASHASLAAPEVLSIPQPSECRVDHQRQYLPRCREFMERAVRVAPIVMLLDDLHWADDASLAMLEHSAGYLDTLPIIVLGTYRDADLDVNRGFARVLETLTRQRLAHRLLLKRLPAERRNAGGHSRRSRRQRWLKNSRPADGKPLSSRRSAHLKEEGKPLTATATGAPIFASRISRCPRWVIGRRLATRRLSQVRVGGGHRPAIHDRRARATRRRE
jgi:hypothetical protein